MEFAIFFIKPDWMTTALQKKILGRIEAKPGLRIVETRKVVLTLPMLEALYERHTSARGHEAYWQAMQADLLDKTVTAGIVSGEHVLWDILAATGVSTKPDKCPPGTIRYDFGNRVKPVLCGELRYWKNVIHRSSLPSEVERDLRLFFPDWHSPQL